MGKIEKWFMGLPTWGKIVLGAGIAYLVYHYVIKGGSTANAALTPTPTTATTSTSGGVTSGQDVSSSSTDPGGQYSNPGTNPAAGSNSSGTTPTSIETGGGVSTPSTPTVAPMVAASTPSPSPVVPASVSQDVTTHTQQQVQTVDTSITASKTPVKTATAISQAAGVAHPNFAGLTTKQIADQVSTATEVDANSPGHLSFDQWNTLTHGGTQSLPVGY